MTSTKHNTMQKTILLATALASVALLAGCNGSAASESVSTAAAQAAQPAETVQEKAALHAQYVAYEHLAPYQKANIVMRDATKLLLGYRIWMRWHVRQPTIGEVAAEGGLKHFTWLPAAGYAISHRRITLYIHAGRACAVIEKAARGEPPAAYSCRPVPGKPGLYVIHDSGT